MLPYSLKGFAEIVRKDPTKYSEQFQDSSIAWQARFIQHNEEIDGYLFVILEPTEGPPFRVRAEVSAKSFNDLPKKARTRGGLVWVIGVIVNCSEDGVDLRNARLKPDASAAD